jgi:hypothetical protein
VTRLKVVAVENNWLITIPRCNLPEELRKKVKSALLPLKELQEKLCRIADEKCPNILRAQDIQILDSGSLATDREQHEARLQQFGAAAAEQLAKFFSGVGSVGVTWGNTIWWIIRALEANPSCLPEHKKPITFVPLSGVLLNDPSIKLSSTSLVEQLHQLVNPESKEPPLSLGAAPARIPYRFQKSGNPLSDEERQALIEFTHDIRDYRKIFPPDKHQTDMKASPRAKISRQNFTSSIPKVELLDALITSVGCDYSLSDDPWLDEVSTRENLPPSDLARVTHGDIGGVFLPKEEIEKTEPEMWTILKDINDRWMGAKQEHFENCAKKAALSRMPGVILVAVGSRKARIVTECVRKGLVNQLIIDSDLAQAIVELDAPT